MGDPLEPPDTLPPEDRKTPSPTREPPRYVGWRINVAATALVIATLLVGYGLAHPREIALPFSIDTGTGARAERGATPESRSASTASPRDGDGRGARAPRAD